MDVSAEIEVHRRRLIAIAARILRDASEAEDVLQDVAVIAMLQESIDNVPGWLTTVVKREAIKRLEKRRADCQREIAMAQSEAIKRDGYTLKELFIALQYLPEEMRDLIVQKEIDGLSIDEICEKNGFGKTWFFKKLGDAKAELKRLLDGSNG